MSHIIDSFLLGYRVVFCLQNDYYSISVNCMSVSFLGIRFRFEYCFATQFCGVRCDHNSRYAAFPDLGTVIYTDSLFFQLIPYILR